MALKIIFAGTPEFAATGLQALIDSEHQVVATYTQPDRKAGRGRKLVAPPVKQLALEHHIPVFQPLSLKDEDQQQLLAQHQADIMVVIAYGLLLPKAVLDTPRLGCINVHASILPRWRGAAPIQRAIQAGDAETGVTIMQMDVGLDTGDMLLTDRLPINAEHTSASLHDDLAKLGSGALIEALSQLEKGDADATMQDHDAANYAHKLDKAEAQLDWSKSAVELDRQIRAFTPWPGAQTEVDGKRWRIHAIEVSDDSGTAGEILSINKQAITVACGSGSLRLTRIQQDGGKPLNCADFINGLAERGAGLVGKHVGTDCG